ncbi:unknown similar to AMEV040 [Adoxophyes honmai entomopoxvirus 'L']|uniref:Uncharacterized protein n=1 Tax=Adoxophyes honmai entomopoxvirus 'L' TaxID=1293540 RepID=A0A916NWM6_9POXV|nr:unknown similar to AMEV040 [Adoxophyes honmai entomopoxvirus 'L']CCU55362.1 unknown similar to AMEV040 [Adoxophyes honmai entomopoxvirus 'L']
MIINIVINNDIIDSIIYHCYKNKLPNNYIFKNILQKYIFKNIECKNVLYIIQDVAYNDCNKYINNDCFIYEYISFFDNYSPMLNYYDKNKINYKKCEDDINLCNFKYLKLLDLCEFNYEKFNQITNTDDIAFNNFITGLYNKDKYYSKFIYFLINYKFDNPDFMIDAIKIPGKINIILPH